VVAVVGEEVRAVGVGAAVGDSVEVVDLEDSAEAAPVVAVVGEEVRAVGVGAAAVGDSVEVVDLEDSAEAAPVVAARAGGGSFSKRGE